MEERLQKIIARAGIASRRKAEDLIVKGLVTVNGEVVMELGTKADPEKDHIKVAGKLVQAKKEFTYILLNKPKGILSSLSDPEDRPVVTDLLKGIKARVYPVGRLDMNTEGALLLTDDGELANRLTAPQSHCPKTYLVKVSGKPEAEKIQLMERGMTVDGSRYRPCKVTPLVDDRNSWLMVELTEGKNHQIKNMFNAIGCPVSKLRRVAFAFLQTIGLQPGQYRHLTSAEISRLKRSEYRTLLPINGLTYLKDLGVKIPKSALIAARPNLKKGKTTRRSKLSGPGTASAKSSARSAPPKAGSKPALKRPSKVSADGKPSKGRPSKGPGPGAGKASTKPKLRRPPNRKKV